MRSIIKKILKESTKKDRFIDYIVDDLKSKTNSKGRIVFSNWDGQDRYNRWVDPLTMFHDEGVPGTIDTFMTKKYHTNDFEAQVEVWNRYMDWWKNEFINTPLTESEDKIDKYYDVVVDDLVRNTEISFDDYGNYSRPVLKVPYWKQKVQVNEFDPDILPHPSVSFRKYVKKKYGTQNSDEVKEIWKRYKFIVWDHIYGDKGIIWGRYTEDINESDNREEKLQNYVIDSLLKQTIVDQDKLKIHYSFINKTTDFGSFFENTTRVIGIKVLIRQYIEDMFGYEDRDDSYRIYYRYYYKLIDKIHERDNINESMTKQDKFYKFIVDNLIKSTKISGNKFYAPHKPHAIYNVLVPINDNPPFIYPYDSLYSGFLEYVKDIYGISDSDIDNIFDVYSKSIIDVITSKNIVSESRNQWSKRHNYYDFIVNDLLKNTTERGVYVKTPFSDAYIFNKETFEEEDFRARYDFTEYIEERYGVNSMEKKLIWDLYRHRVLKEFFNLDI
jgi:hypothetical protein